MRYRKDISAGVIVFRRDGARCEFLLLLSRLTKRPLWEFPKGGVDPGETAMQAALRELEEETGLTPSEVRLLPGFERTESYRFMVGEGERRALVHKRVTYFLAEAVTNHIEISASEATEFAWLELEEAIRRVRYTDRRSLLRSAADAAGCSGGA